MAVGPLACDWPPDYRVHSDMADTPACTLRGLTWAAPGYHLHKARFRWAGPLVLAGRLAGPGGV